jgi:RHS repeat-associated protein
LEATWRVFPLARISNACGIFTHYQPFLYPSIPAEMYRTHRAVLKSVLFSLSFRRKVLKPAQPVYMVYDKRDRLVLTQDGNQRQDNHWTFTKYDALNRPVLTGTKTISGSRDAVQAAVNDFYEQSNPMYETRSGNWNTGDHGYTDLSYPKGISEYSYLTATYYDDYGFHGGESAYVPITGDDIDIVEHLPKPKGQATGAKVKVLGDNEFLKSSTYYDNKYRVILTRAGQYNGDHQQLLLSKAITEEGYIYIYVSNESNLNVNVYFDDLKITHTAADMVVQANDYYPFGLTMKPSDFQRDGEQGNKFLYNGKELQTDLNLDWYDYGARMYDASIGRFLVIDPMADIMSGWNPYHYTFNNPIAFADPTGMKPVYAYDWNSEKYIKTKKNGKIKEVSADVALRSAKAGSITINSEDGIGGFIEGTSADPSKPHYFESEARGVGFMIGISFSDKKPDKNGAVTSPETSAWMLSNSNNGKNMLAVMPWAGNNNGFSDNSYFDIADIKTSPNLTIGNINYNIIGHIHTHPNFYDIYEGPSKSGGTGNKGDFAMNILPIPKYVIGRNEISKFNGSTPNDHKWVYNRTTKKYVNHFFLTKTANFINGKFSFFQDATK